MVHKEKRGDGPDRSVEVILAGSSVEREIPLNLSMRLGVLAYTCEEETSDRC